MRSTGCSFPRLTISSGTKAAQGKDSLVRERPGTLTVTVRIVRQTAAEGVFPLATGSDAMYARCPPSRTGVARAKIPTTTPDYTTVSVSDLIRACGEGKAAAWQEFIHRFHRIITITAYRAARRRGETSQAVIDDLTQDTYLKLCARDARVLCEFDSPDPGAIFAFLKVVTTNVANDYFKRLHAGKRGGSQVCESLDDVEREGGAAVRPGEESVERAMLLDEVDACLSEVAPPATRERDRTIFWLYYRQGWTAKEIVGLPSVGLSLKGVESTLHRLTQLVRNRLVERGSKASEKGFRSGLRI